jgi:mRNA interferase RelE/StbE
MEVRYSKKFLKQLAGIPRGTRLKIEDFVFNEISTKTSIGEVGKIEKMQGYANCYKFRFGDYRVGFLLEDDVLTVKAVMHRKEIYRFFP